MPNHFTYWYGLFLIASFESSSVEHPLDQRWKLHICFYFYLRNFSLILYSRRDQITTYLFPSSLLTHKQFGDVVHKFECQFLRSLPDKVFFFNRWPKQISTLNFHKFCCFPLEFKYLPLFFELQFFIKWFDWITCS